MIGARTGDGMLHLVLRLNGCPDEDKVMCAVQLLGRGIDWERPNADGALSSMVDPPAFKQAYIKRLPRWKEEQQTRQQQQRKQNADRRKTEAAARLRQADTVNKLRRQQNWAAVRAKAAEEVQREKQRDRYHLKLQSALEKLERREQRAAAGKLGELEQLGENLGKAVRVAQVRVDRWLRGFGL